MWGSIFFIELSILTTNHTVHQTLMYKDRFSHVEQICRLRWHNTVIELSFHLANSSICVFINTDSVMVKSILERILLWIWCLKSLFSREPEKDKTIWNPVIGKLIILLSFRWTIDVGWTSTWVRIVNEWLAACVYCKYKQTLDGIMFHFDYLIHLRHKTIKPTNKVFQSVRHALTAIWIILTKEHDFAVWMLVAPILWKSRQAAEPVWPFQNIFSTWFIDSPLPRADGGRQSHFCTQKRILAAAAAARPLVSLVIWFISFKQ